MEKYTVTAVDLRAGEEFELIVEADEGETTENIVLKAHALGRDFEAEDYGYFSAFQKLRDLLLEMNCGIKCCGSCINAVQSGMQEASTKYT